MKNKKRFGARPDGTRVHQTDPMHVIFPYLLPNRTDNEAALSESIELDPIRKYLEKKNEDFPEFKYTIFHVVLAALARVIAERPCLNRFYAGDRLYQRNNISFAFVAKKDYSDDCPETLAIIKYDPELEKSPMSQVFESVRDVVTGIRKEGKETDKVSGIMGIVSKLPGFLIKFVVWVLKTLEYFGKYPKSLMETDPYYTSCFVSNLGSIRLCADYHHLANRGTNSLFVIIGHKKTETYVDREGNVAVRDMLPLGITVDERIADGVYFAKSLSKLRRYLANPELLEQPIVYEKTEECKNTALSK